MTRLLIKYQEKYVCEQNRNEIDFIHVPKYNKDNQPYSNLSIIITLIATSHLKSDYSSNVTLPHTEWSDLFEEYFLPEYLFQVDDNIYIYDLDKLISENPLYSEHYAEALKKLPYNLIIKELAELKNSETEEFVDEIAGETTYSWNFDTTHINKELENFVKKRQKPISPNDVLLLYSGGKDSTLSAIRLYNAGYNIHFIHFDNGNMRDNDKPYLTFKKIFQDKDGFSFDYELSSVDIKNIFDEYFSKWSKEIDSSLEDATLTSEIRCLSCRLAMYTKALQIAKEKGFKYIAEGARISQKFMLEQPSIINRLKELSASFGIKLLLPVLYLEDDKLEIAELIQQGYSSKTWESKCLIGRKAKDKTDSDERAIIEYYESTLQPLLKKKIQ